MNGGVQTATRQSGAASEVFAAADPVGQLFDRWIGDSGILLQPSERESGVRPLTTNATVTATFRSRAPFDYTTITIKGQAESAGAVTARYYFAQPLPPRGVVFRFHGSGGSAIGVTTGTEDDKFNRDLVADGYAVVALDSNDRVNRQWDNLTPAVSGNLDSQSVQTLISRLVALGLVDGGTRYFAAGHSNGGAFAPLVAYQFTWRGCYVSCARGNQPQLQQVSSIPTIWTVAQNDSTIGADGIAGATANFQTLSGRGIAAQFITFVPGAVYASRFTQIIGLGPTDSQTIYASFKSHAILDAADFIQTNDETAITTAIPPTYSIYSKEIIKLMRVAYAEHEFSAAASGRIRAFFSGA